MNPFFVIFSILGRSSLSVPTPDGGCVAIAQQKIFSTSNEPPRSTRVHAAEGTKLKTRTKGSGNIIKSKQIKEDLGVPVAKHKES